METMYPGKINSPSTGLSAAIDGTQTTISLYDASVMPAGPNIAVIGLGDDAETILYASKSGNNLTGCTRGFQGTAKAWGEGINVARFFTAYDYEALRQNTQENADDLAAHLAENATTSAKGHIQLQTTVDNNETKALTPKGLNDHLTDYVRQPGYGTSAGSANTYTLTLSPVLTAYTAGVCVAIKIHTANTGASTININGLGAKSILDSKGNAVTSGKLRLNGVYTLRYDGTNFILQGEGGDINFAAGNNVLYTEQMHQLIQVSDTSWLKKVGYTIGNDGSYRVSHTLQKSSASDVIYSIIRVNGIDRGTLRTFNTSASSITYTEDITVTANDTIEIWVYRVGLGGSMYLDTVTFAIATATPVVKSYSSN